MNGENSILGNQLVVMSRADLDALVERMAINMNAMKVEDKPTARLLHVDYSTLWRWNKLGLLCPNKVGPRRVMYKYSDVLKKLNGEG